MLAPPLLQLVPACVGPVQERHIVGVFVIGLANDARVAVRAAAVVAQRKLFQPEHAAAAAGKLERRRGAHAADAEDDDLVAAVLHDTPMPKFPLPVRDAPRRPSAACPAPAPCTSAACGQCPGSARS